MRSPRTGTGRGFGEGVDRALSTRNRLTAEGWAMLMMYRSGDSRPCDLDPYIGVIGAIVRQALEDARRNKPWEKKAGSLWKWIDPQVEWRQNRDEARRWLEQQGVRGLLGRLGVLGGDWRRAEKTTRRSRALRRISA